MIFALQAFNVHAREALMDIIEDRFSYQSTIVSSQIPVSIGEGTIADTISDRLTKSSHRRNIHTKTGTRNVVEWWIEWKK